MKKKIGFVSMDPSLAKWLVDRMKTMPPSVSSDSDFWMRCAVCSPKRTRR